jgi:hypothetical protein
MYKKTQYRPLGAVFSGALAEEIVRSATPEQLGYESSEGLVADVRSLLQTPEIMHKQLFQQLHALVESQGGDWDPAVLSGARHALEGSPFTVHPKFGCITKALAEIRDDPDWAEFTGSSRFQMSDAEKAAILKTTDPAMQDLRTRVIESATVSDEDRDIFVMAKGYARDGDLEFDTDAIISSGDDNGAYVGGFKWIDFSGTHLDKDVEEDEPDDDSPAAERPTN